MKAKSSLPRTNVYSISKEISMFKLSDLFILLAVAVSFAVSGLLWFEGEQLAGLFTAIWVPSILAFGIYFKLSSLLARRDQS
jgi:hypothetical protein|tara:strand:+ start:193 stop:438 length:246 start_codon:yes stop_codon:yes gene_type:complete